MLDIGGVSVNDMLINAGLAERRFQEAEEEVITQSRLHESSTAPTVSDDDRATLVGSVSTSQSSERDSESGMANTLHTDVVGVGGSVPLLRPEDFVEDIPTAAPSVDVRSVVNSESRTSSSTSSAASSRRESAGQMLGIASPPFNNSLLVGSASQPTSVSDQARMLLAAAGVEMPLAEREPAQVETVTRSSASSEGLVAASSGDYHDHDDEEEEDEIVVIGERELDDSDD